MFQVGDAVRLIRGWRRMVVIGFDSVGHVIAKYDHDRLWDYSRVHNSDFSYPLASTRTQIRSAPNFVKWDGDPVKKVFYTVSNRYKSIKQPHISGEFLNTSSSGAIIIEQDNGSIVVLDAQDAARDIPFTFQAKSTNNSYSCHYTLPAGASVEVGDLLVSQSGNTYFVRAVDTQWPNPKGPFKGHRLVKESL